MASNMLQAWFIEVSSMLQLGSAGNHAHRNQEPKARHTQLPSLQLLLPCWVGGGESPQTGPRATQPLTAAGQHSWTCECL
jgi:hypothetical protein